MNQRDLHEIQTRHILETAVRQSIQMLQLGDDAEGVRPILEDALQTIERIR